MDKKRNKVLRMVIDKKIKAYEMEEVLLNRLR